MNRSRPQVTLISAVYNVSKFLGDFFDSLETQTLAHERIEVILVDDGSTDDSLALCRKFAEHWPGPASVLVQPNGGQASARNRGLEVATGAWVSFADPDDMLEPDYFRRLVEFADRPENHEAVIHAAVMVTFDEATGLRARTHVLDFRFTEEDRVIDLDMEARHVHLHAASSLIRRDAIEVSGLRFDERIRPSFEDAAFLALLLLDQPTPRIGFVTTASYLYRKRAKRNSTLDKARVDPRRYTDVLRFGHLGVLAHARDVADARDQSLPRWVQNVVLYDLLWIFKDSQTMELMSADFSDEVFDEFSNLLDEILAAVTNDAIAAFDVVGTPWWCLPALLLRKNAVSHSAPWRGAEDRDRGLASLRYLHAGTVPAERLSVDEKLVLPHFVRDLQCLVLNRPFVWEREVWTPRGEQRVCLDDVPQPIYDWHGPVMDRFLWFYPLQPPSLQPRVLTPRPGQPAELAPPRSKRAKRVARRYSDAWVVMDRDNSANDCGEIFYKWLRVNRPQVKAYFVLRKDVPDWKRLRSEGIKPVAHGSQQWKDLMLNARHMISSQIDEYVVNPLPVAECGKRQWKFTFLQHGVTKDNIFNWFNQKEIDVFITSTDEEYDYCAGPGPSRFGNREVRLTGMPRFDDLLRQAKNVGPDEQRYLLVAPTWRFYLIGAAGTGNDRSLNSEFMATTYARAWSQLLHSEELQRISEAAGTTIAFMPHPNVQPYLDQFELPSWVTVLRHQDVDIRAILARSSMMITDYSSIAFDLAYLYRHVVYFQFDKAEFFSGGHVFTPGYFDYLENGFGPVANDLHQVLASVREVLTGSIDDRYAERMRSTFPVRDGGNCQRTYEAIVATETALTFEEAATAAPFETWELIQRDSPRNS